MKFTSALALLCLTMALDLAARTSLAQATEKPIPLPPKAPVKATVVPKMENEPFMTCFLDSAAHYYQVEGGLAAVALVRSQLGLNTDTKTTDIRNDISRSGIEALGVFAPLPIFRGGISFYRLNDTYDSGVTSDDLSFDSKRKEEESNYTPFGELDLMQSISLGMEYSLTTRTLRPDNRETRSISSSRVSPSVVYHRPGFEIGIVYRPTVLLEENGISQIETGSATISSQYLICDGTSVGVAFQEIRNRELDVEAYRNSYEPKVAVESRAFGFVKLGGSLAYRTSSAKEDLDASPLTIPRVITQAFTSVAVGSQARLGFTYFNYYARKKVENSSHKTIGHSGELVGSIRF